jgi:hypothetical protein
VIRREHWAEITLAEGDRIEIVHFVGGGSGGSRTSCRSGPGTLRSTRELL